MHICLTNQYFEDVTPDQWVKRDVTRREIAAALARRGHQVTVIQSFSQNATYIDGRVTWIFVKHDRWSRISHHALAALGDPWPMLHSPNSALLQAIKASNPDILHSFDLTAYPSLWAQGHYAKSRNIPFFAHYHGGSPAKNLLNRVLEAAATRTLTAALFSTPERAFGSCPTRLVFETSTDFQPLFQTHARQRTGITGSPAILCPGRLEINKDPATVVRAFANILPHNPKARLYLCYTAAPLQNEIKNLVQMLGIQSYVCFAGPQPQDQMPLWYCASDVVVQASRREVLGRAPLEALACGVPVILADIPAARLITNNGKEGGLFPCGAVDALAGFLLDPSTYDPAARERARSWFEKRFSFSCLVDSLEDIYQEARGSCIGGL